MIVQWLINNDEIQERDKILYMYALNSIKATVIPLILAFVMCVMLRIPLANMLLVIPFMIIRKYSGGYHAGTIYQCLVLSCIVLAISFAIAVSIRFSIGLNIALILSIIIIWMISPIDSDNKRLNAEEKKNMACKTRGITCGICGAIYLTWLLGKEQLAIDLTIGLILVAALQIPCIPLILSKRRPKRHENCRFENEI